MVCLARSRRLMGRCIAGKQWEAGQATESWIRPVSQRENQEISEYERQCADGSDPRNLDIVDVPMPRPKPVGCQTENWLIDPKRYWRRVGLISPLDLPVPVDPVEPLWVDGHGTHHGLNDKVPVEACGEITSSLRLISVNEIELRVFAPSEAFGDSKRRVQGSFLHADQKHAFWVTDPACERRFLAKQNGTYRQGKCCLTVSLGEQFKGNIFKLIAAAIELDGH